MLAALTLATRASAQTIDVTSAVYSNSTSSPTTWTWSPLQVYGGGSTFLSDPRADQQTGQYADDMVGNATNNPGFMMRGGTIAGTGTDSSGTAVQYVAFRTRLNEYNPTSYDNNAKQRFGMDANGDGKIDLFFGIDFNNNSPPTIGFQTPGTGSNSSPSTTSIGNNFTPTFDSGDVTVSSALLTLSNSLTFNYQQVNSTNTPGFTNFQGATNDSPAGADAYMTFAVPFLWLAEAVQDASGLTITPSSWVRFIAFTATQNNSINQDLFGSNGITATRFDAPGGGFSEFTNAYGTPVPEPSTYGAILMAGGLAVLGLRRWRAGRGAGQSPTA
jgi:hypothetical protein